MFTPNLGGNGLVQPPTIRLSHAKSDGQFGACLVSDERWAPVGGPSGDGITFPRKGRGEMKPKKMHPKWTWKRQTDETNPWRSIKFRMNIYEFWSIFWSSEVCMFNSESIEGSNCLVSSLQGSWGMDTMDMFLLLAYVGLMMLND